MRHTLRVLVVLAAASLAGPAVAQTPTPFPAATADTTHALGLPRCTAQDGRRVCLAMDSTDAFVVTVARNGAETARWTYVGAPSVLGLRAFDLPTPDTTTASLVATLDAVSNGMGVAYWTVTMLRDGVPTYRFRTEEFGPEGGSFARHEGQPVVWATQWVGGSDPTGQRGEGLYLVGRPFALTPDALVPLAEVSVRARRFLESFVRDERGPVAWLADPAAEARAADPALAGCATRTDTTVTFASAEHANDEWGWPYVRLTTAESTGGGPSLRSFRFGASSADEAHATITHLGDAATRRLFPAGYAPDLRALTGQRLRLETCALEFGVKARVLWLSDSAAPAQGEG